jgi:2-hydroxycyclohexanecarboxyl-CoA dehydrogenase
MVAGGGGAIGAAVCRELAADGAHVAVVDRDGAAAGAVAETLDGGLAVVADLTRSGEVAAAVTRIEDRLGPVDILVNAAGWDEFVPFVDTDEGFWGRVIDVNYTAMLRTCHAVVASMGERGWGRIVNIASDAGRVGSSLEAVYAGAKGGVIAFSKSLAREVARHGVTVNVVCPGPTDTPLIRGMVERMEDGERMLDGLTRAIPLRRLAEPGDIAPAVAYFAGEQAGYVTGQTLSVSGGLTMA